ncbi:HD-GYP domain-containing protein [Knoellia subterranea]|uniref:HD-GYP domain-containing protein n=1 Tax=Knoellia subterranea KCTC 19937 TaxID=1385521 RepID=A0A0A0JQ93_9MICO|nr:HD domain-containing phosphohydrolase [Knoellia subterranea]KGN39615.1 hypothetical protein N803_02500 [Knoellia subterranea KCTC 19937]
MTSKSTSRVERLVLAIAIAMVVWAVVSGYDGLLAAVGDHSVVLGSFLVVIAVGELFRVRMPSGRVAAPVATGSALALALLGPVYNRADLDVSSGVVTLVLAAALVLAMVIRKALKRSTEWYLVAARTIGATVTAWLVRIGSDGGHGVWAWQVNAERPSWLVAVVMLLAAAVGLYIDLVLTALVRARRKGLPGAVTLRDELGEAQALTLGVLAAGPLVAFLAPVIGLAALPLGLLPMVLTYVAVRRYTNNRATYRQTIGTLSRLTEVAGYTPTGHAARVAARSVTIARVLGMHAQEIQDLEYAALLHDLGQVGLRSPIPEGATVMTSPDDQRRIASEGARIVRRTEVLDHVADLMERQTTPFRHVREWGEQIPVESRIIKVANAFDDYSHGRADQASVDAALERIHLGLGYEYDPEVVEALIRTVQEQRI